MIDIQCEIDEKYPFFAEGQHYWWKILVSAYRWRTNKINVICRILYCYLIDMQNEQTCICIAIHNYITNKFLILLENIFCLPVCFYFHCSFRMCTGEVIGHMIDVNLIAGREQEAWLV